jgi:hypothetical protein
MRCGVDMHGGGRLDGRLRRVGGLAKCAMGRGGMMNLRGIGGIHTSYAATATYCIYFPSLAIMIVVVEYSA